MYIALASEPGETSRRNEDWAGVTTSVFAILDGLSSTADSTTGCRHGTPWYVQQLGAQLLASASLSERSLTDSLACAIEAVADLHPECDVTHPGSPSATVALLRAASEGETLEHLVLADARIVLDTPSGSRTITDERVDLVAQAERAAVFREPIGTGRHKQAVAELIATQKPLRNHPDGYWVASGDPTVAEQAITGETPRREVTRAALMSDGASRIVDTFGRLSWTEALDLLDEVGPSGFIRQVREIERTDPDGRRWPRYKSSDDATAVYVRW